MIDFRVWDEFSILVVVARREGEYSVTDAHQVFCFGSEDYLSSLSISIV